MTSTAAQMRNYRGGALFSFGFRPFFLAGSVIAAIVPVITALVIAGVVPFEHRVGFVAWHGHEMIYGYLGAVIAGFLLTAVPNWTGRLPVLGRRLASLFALWLAGRFAMWLAPVHLIAAVVDTLFLVALGGVIAREIIRGKNWRNGPICLMIGLLAVGNLLWHIDIAGTGQGTFGLRWGIAIIVMLISFIGGRITPSFTRNWFAKRSTVTISAKTDIVDKLSLALTAIALGVWLTLPEEIVTAILLAGASVSLLFRLVRWKGWRTTAEPLVTVLHVGYLWVAVGLSLLSISIVAPSFVASSTAIHALTAGAAGTMTLAVMTRATLGHTGRVLSTDRATLAIFVFVNIGAALRIAVPYLPINYAMALTLAGLLWSAAFLIFAIVYGRYLLAPRIDVADNA